MFFSNTFLLTISIFILTFSTLAAARPVIGQDSLSNVDTCIANCDDEPNPHQCKLNCVYGHASLDKCSPFIPGENQNMDHDLCIELCRDAPNPYQCALDCPPSGADVALHKRSTTPLPSASERETPRPDSRASYCMLQCMQDLADMTVCEHRCYGIPPHNDGVDDINKRAPASGSQSVKRRDADDADEYCMLQCMEYLEDTEACEHRCYGITPARNDKSLSISKRDAVEPNPHIEACISGCHDKPHPQQCREHCRTGGIPPDDGSVPTMDRRSVISLPHGSEEKRQDDPSVCMDTCMRGPWDSQTCEKRCYNPLRKRDSVIFKPELRIDSCISNCDAKPHPQQCRYHCRTGGIPPDDDESPTTYKRSVISLHSGSEEKRQVAGDHCMLQCTETLGDSEACQHRCYGFASQKDSSSVSKRHTLDDGVPPPLHKRSVVSLPSGSEEKRQFDPAKCMVECMATPSDAPTCVHRCYGSPPHHNKEISTASKRNTIRSKLDANADQCTVKCSDDASRPYHCKMHCGAGGISSDDGVLRPLHKRSGISPPSGSGEEDCMDDCMHFPWNSQMCEKRCFGSAKRSDEFSSISKRDVEEHPRYPQPYYGNYRQCVNYCEYWQGLSLGDCVKRCHPPSEHQRGTIVKRDRNSNIDGEKIDVTAYQLCLDTCQDSGHSLKQCMAKYCPWAKRSSADTAFHAQLKRSFAGGHAKRDQKSNIDGEKIDISLYQQCLDTCTASGHSLKWCMTTKCPWVKRSTAEELDGSAADFSFHGQSVAGSHTKRDWLSVESDDSKACDAKCSRGPPAVRKFCKQDCLNNWTGNKPPPSASEDRIELRSASTPQLDNLSNGNNHHVKREIDKDGAGVKHAKRDSEDDCASKCALAVNYEECLQNCLW